ncbi:AI-2E family transporter [Vibrio parahaemolyticus]
MNGKLNLPINTVIGVSLLVLLLVPALYFAKPVLLPMVISTFVALLFSPLINYFEDKGLPRTITVVVTLTLLVSVSILGLAAISEPAKQWWAELPSIVQNVSQEVNEVTKASSDHMNAPLELASDMNIDEMGNNTVFSLLKALATTTPTLLTIESQFVTPTLLGRRFNLNPLVIFMWLVFWGWLWGGMGLLIGVPLLVCINILADRLALCGSTNI